MYIRRTKTASAKSGETYYTHRLVASERSGKQVRQRTLLNLGRNFDVPQEKWSDLCIRLEALLAGQVYLMSVDPEIEKHAQYLAAQLHVVQGEEVRIAAAGKEAVYAEVDVDSLELLKPRAIGVEHVALEAIRELELPEMFTKLGFNGRQNAAAIGSIVGRIATPGSELSTWHWLQEQSGLGELIDFDYESMSLMQLYRVSDKLIRHQKEIETGLFARIQSIFSLTPTITLYDLTNTFFEGAACGNKKARRGHSKEKRTDCPLVTLGLVLDGSGFVRKSKVFEGNVSEGTTLESMLTELEAPNNALVVMDRGIAKEENIAWLVEHNYKYLVVSRQKVRSFDEDQSVSLKSATGIEIKIQREANEAGTEAKLYCYSKERAGKEEGIANRFCKRFEEGLQKVADGISNPRGTKKYDKVLERIGRLKEKSRGAGQYYDINVTCDEKKERATEISWKRVQKEGSKLSHPGVYCLRTNEFTMDEETLWRTYTMLTDLEAVFRSLKSELGLRPIYHHKEERSDGHLFITVLAYQAVQLIRTKLKSHGVHDSWNSLRKTMSVQQRITATFKQKDGRVLHVRKATTAEPRLKQLYDILNLTSSPGGIKKLIY